MRFQGGGQAGSTHRLDKAELSLGRLGPQILRHAGRQAAPADRQHHQIRRAAQLVQNLDPDRGLPLNHILIVERSQKMCALLGAELLRGGQRLVEIVTIQHNGDEFAAKGAGLVDLLLRRRHRHEDGARHAEMAAGIGHALRVVSRARTDEMALGRVRRPHLAHRVPRAPQLVAAHWRQIFAFQPDLGPMALRQKVVALQRGARKQLAQRAGRGFGGLGKCGHEPDLAHDACLRKITPAAASECNGRKAWSGSTRRPW